MILIDANVLVALIDDEDALNPRAISDMSNLPRGPVRTTESAISEVCHMCKGAMFIDRLMVAMDQLDIEFLEEGLMPNWKDVLQWMLKYESHRPDWTDAQFAVISSERRQVRVWTYDKEFRTIWRRIDGTKIPLAVDSAR